MKQSIIRIVLCLFCVFSVLEARAAEDVPLADFFARLFTANQAAINRKYALQYRLFTARHRLDHRNAANRSAFLRLRFYHDLFTCRDSVNGPCEGALAVPYFWHWISPNPRHAIKDLSCGKPLTKSRPPKRFGKYQSFADIDRVPSLYLTDLVSEEPRYFHPLAGKFHTFGWCSEREMAFNLFMSLYGFEGRVQQRGPHVWSEFRVEFTARNGAGTILIAKIDNTYDRVSWSTGPAMTKERWLAGFRQSSHSTWYNNMARSNDEINVVRNYPVKEKSQTRITGIVKDFLAGR